MLLWRDGEDGQRRMKITILCHVNALPCVMHTHVFGPNFQQKKSFVLIFKLDYLFIYT